MVIDLFLTNSLRFSASNDDELEDSLPDYVSDEAAPSTYDAAHALQSGILADNDSPTRIASYGFPAKEVSTEKIS